MNGDLIKQHFAGSAVYSFTPAQLLFQDTWIPAELWRWEQLDVCVRAHVMTHRSSRSCCTSLNFIVSRNWKHQAGTASALITLAGPVDVHLPLWQSEVIISRCIIIIRSLGSYTC